MTESTTATSLPAGERRPLPAAGLWAGVLVTGALGSMLFEEIERRTDPSVGYGDHLGVLLYGVLPSLVAVAVSVWAARTELRTAQRVAVVMAVMAVLTLPLFYWSGSPAALGLGAYLSVRSRPATGAGRAAGITGAVVALAVSAFSVVTGLVAPPWS